MSDGRLSELEAELASARASIAALEDQIQQQSRIEARIRALYDHIPDMVLSIDEEFRITGCNRTSEERLGRVSASLLGSELREFLEPESGAALIALCQTGFEGLGDSEVSLSCGTKVGFSVARIDEQSIQMVLRDLTPMQRLQDELLNTRRMASVGQLAGGIAHEINNPLAVIQGRVEMLRAVPDMPVETRSRHLDILEEHCGRVSRIVRNLHTFARPRIPDRRWISFSEVIAETVESLGRRLERVSLELSVPDALQIYADPDQLQLVLLNLLSSAADTSAPDRVVRVVAEDVGGGAVEVRFDDEGPGLSDELLEGLRAPSAAHPTSVESGRGLGLSISWGIVQEHGGWLTAENRDPRGTTVVFRVSGADDVVGELSSGTSQGRSILVVDDDRVMCETIAWMLTSEGHRIVSVHSAEEAIVQIGVDHFDMVITDQRLPGMDGEGLIAHIEEHWPDLLPYTMLTSGLLYRPRQTRRYLQKPFSKAQLLKLIGELEA